jgi:hypothetical protein
MVNLLQVSVSFDHLPGGILLRKMVNGNGKGKAIPLQAWTRPEGSRRLRLPDFKTIGI